MGLAGHQPHPLDGWLGLHNSACLPKLTGLFSSLPLSAVCLLELILGGKVARPKERKASYT